MNKKALIFQAQVLKGELSDTLGKLEYDFDSLSRIEDFINRTVAVPGKPLSKSFFADETSSKAIALGAFAGEVVRRELPYVTWNVKGEMESPLEISLVNSSGAVGFVVNKAFKRIYEGDEDNLLFFSKIMVKELLKEEDPSIDYFDEEDLNIVKYGNSQLCMISKGIYHGDLEIDDANFSDGIWLFTNQAEGVSEDNEDAFDYIFLDEVKDRFPKLYAEITNNVQDGRIRIIKEANGEYRFQKSHKELFFDGSSMASFQGNMKLNFLQWIKMNTSKVLRITSYLFISFFAMIKIHWSFGIVFVLCLLYNIWYWFTTKGTFGGGNVSPGKVIEINPDRIAVVTDLSKMTGQYPVIKIIKTKLLKENRVIGKFIPTVAVYNENPHGYPFWSEFHPVPVSHGITDKKHLDYLMSKFAESDFSDIDSALTQVDASIEGTFKLDGMTSGWKDFQHVDINKGVRMEGPIEEGGS